MRAAAGRLPVSGDLNARQRRRAVAELVHRKRRLVLETPYRIRGRAVIVHVEASGLTLREKGRSVGLETSWAQIYNRAAEIAADCARRERKESKRVRLPGEQDKESGRHPGPAGKEEISGLATGRLVRQLRCAATCATPRRSCRSVPSGGNYGRTESRLSFRTPSVARRRPPPS